MIGRTGFRRGSQKVNFSKMYKRQENVESHDRLRTEGTLHIQKKKNILGNGMNLPLYMMENYKLTFKES